MKSTWMVVLGIAVPLLTAGCGSGGGSGLFSLFGSSGASDILDSFGSGSDSGSGGTILASTGGSSSGPSGSSQTVHNPEPASIGLFAGGLASLALARRRRKTRK